MKTKVLVLSVLILICQSAASKIIVIELDKLDDDRYHQQQVEAIACKNKSENCFSIYTASFANQNFADQYIPASKSNAVVNMSFQMQRKHLNADLGFANPEVYRERKLEIEQFDRDKNFLIEMIEAGKNNLFVIAAGNGVSISGMMSKGLALQDFDNLVPQKIQRPNTIVVASANIEKFDPQLKPTYQITEESNYSLDSVDALAPVEKSTTGEPLSGTSFSTPWISRLSDALIDSTQINVVDVKKVILRSCHIPDIRKAIEASEDINKNRERSIYYQAQFHRKRSVRQKIQKSKQLKNLHLVRCGGVVVEEVAQICASNYMKQLGDRSVSEAERSDLLTSSCLKAQKQVLNITQDQQESLKRLWNIRFNNYLY